MLSRTAMCLTCLVAIISLPAAAEEQVDDQAHTVRAVVLYFPGPEGLDLRLADRLRLKLRRQEGWDVVDRITTQDMIDRIMVARKLRKKSRIPLATPEAPQ